MENKLTMYAAIAFVVIVLGGGVVGAVFMFGRGERMAVPVYPRPSATACTMEAKICPDGSAVGRTGPNCEFSPCPTSVTTSTTQPSFSFPTPKPIVSKYMVQPDDMQPKVGVLPGSFTCTASEGTVQKTINTRKYCVTSVAGVAAGTTYTTYTYVTERAKNLISLTFTIGQGTCANYDEPQKSVCTREQKAFNVDSYADKLVQTIELK